MHDSFTAAGVSQGVIGIGTDLVEVSRIEALIERYPRKSLSRIFTITERKYSESRGSRYQHYAARIAAKEAVFKALGTGLGSGMTWHQVQVENGDSGEPRIRLTGATLRRFKEIGGTAIHASLSHTDQHALAFVVLLGHGRPPAAE